MVRPDGYVGIVVALDDVEVALRCGRIYVGVYDRSSLELDLFFMFIHLLKNVFLVI
jgi:hypothetical protein